LNEGGGSARRFGNVNIYVMEGKMLELGARRSAVGWNEGVERE
jgi:hypothetical protein